MNLQVLKQKLNEVGFSEEVLSRLNEIVDAAIAKGLLGGEEKRQMQDLIDLDIEAGVLEANTAEDVSLVLSSFAGAMEKAVEIADEKEAEVEADVENVVSKIGQQVESPATETLPTAPTM